MRYRTKGSVEGFFAGDIPGGMRIECQNCYGKTPSLEPCGEALVCQYCNKELHYPEGASW